MCEQNEHARASARTRPINPPQSLFPYPHSTILKEKIEGVGTGYAHTTLHQSLALVVQMMDCAIHQKFSGYVLRNPLHHALDKDLSRGLHYPPMNNWSMVFTTASLAQLKECWPTVHMVKGLFPWVAPILRVLRYLRVIGSAFALQMVVFSARCPHGIYSSICL